ncbi:MAG: hypothetical protein U0414_02495 [Polyangiaceae bacterium]
MPCPSKMARFLVPVALLLGGGAGCRSNAEPEEASALLAQVKADGYTMWARAPGFDSRKPSDAPHGDAVEIFVNPIVADALTSQQAIAAWPDGSIIVKDGYDDEGTHVLTSILEKRGAEWFWAEYDEDDEPVYSGSPGVCRACHESGADFVRAFGFPKP